MTALSASSRSHANHSGIGQSWAVWAAIGLALLSPIFRGGNRYVPLTLLEGLGLAMLLAWGWQSLLGNPAAARFPLGTGWRRWAMLALLTLPAWAAFVYLIPLPMAAGWHALSTVPQATWASALAGIPIAAMLLTALLCDAKSLQWLVRAWILAAVVQAAIGILQLGGFEVLNFGASPAEGAVGTFANRNHFASFIAMTIPLAMLSLKAHPAEKGEAGSFSWSAVAMLFVLVAAVFASLSRAGLVIGLTAATATGWMLWRPNRQRGMPARSSLLWALVPLLVILALAVGGLDWLSRFDAAQLEASAREREINRLAAWAAAQQYWPWGSGLGTFSSAFTPYQAPEIEQFVEHAHNDYVQWLLEIGLIFPLVLLMALALIGRRLIQLIKGQDRHSAAGHLALASAMGLLAVALHAWVDFPLRIPANAVLAAFLLGVFLREPATRGARKSSGLPSAGSGEPD